MHKIIAVLVTSALFGHTAAFAAERPAAVLITLHSHSIPLNVNGGVLHAAAVREAARLAKQAPRRTAQTGTSKASRSGGHPVLIGTAVGAGAGAILGYAGASCSLSGAGEAAACGSHYKGGSAVVGAALGAGIGAVVGLVIKAAR